MRARSMERTGYRGLPFPELAYLDSIVVVVRLISMVEKRSLRVSRGRHSKPYETVYHLHHDLFSKFSCAFASKYLFKL
jgi:hypothetical protein